MTAPGSFRRIRRALGILLSMWCAGAGAAAPDQLYDLIDARLELMDEVAAAKWRAGQPIEDLDREALVLDRAEADALRYGFTRDSSRRLFAAQIEAAKAIQRHWFAVWSAGPEPSAVADLETDVRPQLLRLGDAILAAAARQPTLDAEAFAAAVDVAGLDPQSRNALFAALEDLERYPHRLAQVLDGGTVRVGTTGDYAPFSHRDDPSAAFVGIDIDLARSLAAALGVQVTFVPTSWPTLMADLAAGRFDIGMSGISRTVERQRRALLSQPYHVGGKTPIARCDAAARFGSLEAIDRPEVRVVVNPGGTNERFVDSHLRHARKLLHPDNRSIFAVLVDGGADVMITDRVEVTLQTSRHPELCATMPGNLTYQEKAYLMPQDPVWQAFVDTWLSLAIADGSVAQAFRDHAVAPPNPAAGAQSNAP